MFAELLRILEKRGAIGLKGRPSALRSIAIGAAQDVGDCLLGARRVVFGEPRLVAFEQPLQDSDGGGEVVADGEQQIDVVEIFLAVEAVGEVVARIDGGLHFAAVRA